MSDDKFGDREDKRDRKMIDEAVNFFDKNLSSFFNGILARHYQILMMFAA
jgi:hypothetical protein